MKRMIRFVVIAALLCVGAFGAQADTSNSLDIGTPAFAGTWRCENYTVQIDDDNGAYRCVVTLNATPDTETRWSYTDCRYDVETGALVCADGVKSHTIYAGSDISTQTMGFNLQAEFTLDGDSLEWNELRDGEGDDMVFFRAGSGAASEEEAGDGDAFLGTWACGRATIEITAEDDDYHVEIDWADSASEEYHWEYDCEYDASSDSLVGEGTLTDRVYGEDGEVESEEELYDDGAAEFTINDEGGLLWDDWEEQAAEDMVFTPVRIVAVAPTADDLADGFFRVVADWHPGTAGSSLALAETACEVLGFAEDNCLWDVDPDALWDNLAEAWESLDADEQADFSDAFISVADMIDDTLAHWEKVQFLYEDAGVKDVAAPLVKDPRMADAWENLRDNTLPLGLAAN